MASVNQTRPHCVNQMGKTHSKPLAARHGRGTARAQHGNCMFCLNRPYVFLSLLVCSRERMCSWRKAPWLLFQWLRLMMFCELVFGRSCDWYTEAFFMVRWN